MRSVFLTGATGTIGSALVPQFLADRETVVSLLVRARDDGDLHSRLARLCSYWQFAPGDPCTTRIRAIRGDVTQPALGLSADDYARLTSETTHIVHCAASVRLNMTAAEAHATAVVPTRAVLALGRECAQSGSLRKIDMVTSVSGGSHPAVIQPKMLTARA